MKKIGLFLLNLLIVGSIVGFKPSNGVIIHPNDFTQQSGSEADKQKIAQLLASNTPITWLFTGNSITQGAKHTHGYRAYPEIFAERVRFEMWRLRDIVVNTAISGNTTKNILDDFDWRIAKLKPKVVLLMIGTNDAAIANQISTSQYSQNLLQIVTKVRSLNAVPVLISPTPIREDLAPERGNLKLYVEAMKKIAEENGVIFVNNWTVWKTELHEKYQGQISQKLLNDPLHPNGLGHKEITIALLKELNIFDPNRTSGGAPHYKHQY